ncbi:MAG: transcriptional repressor [bacterium]
MDRDRAENILRQNKLRQTADRLRLLELIDPSRAWTAEQLHAELNDINLSTVYRNLTVLTESDVLNASSGRDGKTLYELADQDHHAHSVCDSCGLVSCVPCPLRRSDGHSLELYETCDSCRRQRRKK